MYTEIMQFRLFYKGELKPNKRNIREHKQSIRIKLHPQVKKIWDLPPLCFGNVSKLLLQNSSPNKSGIIREIEGREFAPLVTEKYGMRAKLEILLLRPFQSGQFLYRGGDLDNQIKTLLDSLRMPLKNDENPIIRGLPKRLYCLLEDDSLVTDFSVETDRLLKYRNKNEVIAVVNTKISQVNRNFDYVRFNLGNTNG